MIYKEVIKIINISSIVSYSEFFKCLIVAIYALVVCGIQVQTVENIY